MGSNMGSSGRQHRPERFACQYADEHPEPIPVTGEARFRDRNFVTAENRARISADWVMPHRRCPVERQKKGSL